MYMHTDVLGTGPVRCPLSSHPSPCRGPKTQKHKTQPAGEQGQNTKTQNTRPAGEAKTQKHKAPKHSTGSRARDQVPGTPSRTEEPTGTYLFGALVVDVKCSIKCDLPTYSIRTAPRAGVTCNGPPYPARCRHPGRVFKRDTDGGSPAQSAGPQCEPQRHFAIAQQARAAATCCICEACSWSWRQEADQRSWRQKDEQ